MYGFKVFQVGLLSKRVPHYANVLNFNRIEVHSVVGGGGGGSRTTKTAYEID